MQLTGENLLITVHCLAYFKKAFFKLKKKALW